MTAADAFRRAIWRERDNDDLRTAFADWLEDHGGEEYGEFIRVQCELARPQTGEPWCFHDITMPSHCPRCRLRRRERELLATHPASWLPDAIHDLNLWVQEDVIEGREIRFRRGFVAEVALSWQDWSRHHPAILDAAPLERVVLTTWPEWEGDGRGEEYLRLHGCERWHRIPFGALPNGSARETIAGKLLSAEWPRLEFDLSRVRRYVNDADFFTDCSPPPTAFNWTISDSDGNKLASGTGVVPPT